MLQIDSEEEEEPEPQQPQPQPQLGGCALVRTSSAELARTSSAGERAKAAAARAEAAQLQAQERALEKELADVERQRRELLGGAGRRRSSTQRLAPTSRSAGASLGVPRSVSAVPDLRRGQSESALLPSRARERPVQERAVTVEWLVAFTNKHDAWRLRTFEVVEKIVKPLSAERRCRFTELESEVPPDVLGHVDSFVSHCWGGEWGDLVAAAQHNARFGRRFWVDIFAINQHMSGAHDKKALKVRRRKGRIVANQPVAMREDGTLVPQFEDDLARLNFVIRAATQGTTLVLDPRKAIADAHRNPMRRVWCVEEIRETLEAGKALVIKCGAVVLPQQEPRAAPAAVYVPPQQRRELRAKEFKEEWDRAAIEELVFSIDVENAEASVAEDRERILSKIKAIGFDQVNSQVESAVWTAFSGRGLPAWQYAVQGAEALHGALADGDLQPADILATNPEGW